MTRPPHWTDDVLGFFDIIDRLRAWLTFVLRNRRTVEYRMRYNKTHTLNEVIAHLDKYGIKAVRSGFDSRAMIYVISGSGGKDGKGQQRWHDKLVTYRDGVPILYHPKKAWKG